MVVESSDLSFSCSALYFFTTLSLSADKSATPPFSFYQNHPRAFSMFFLIFSTLSAFGFVPRLFSVLRATTSFPNSALIQHTSTSPNRRRQIFSQKLSTLYSSTPSILETSFLLTSWYLVELEDLQDLQHLLVLFHGMRYLQNQIQR